MSESARTPIRFGTSGWRGILGENFTFPALRAAVRGVARWAREQPPRSGAAAAGRSPVRVVVARDTRFLGDRMTRLAVAILRAEGAEPLLARDPVPTPVAAHAVTRRGAAAGIVFTASHNPPEYQGMKVLGSWGGAIREEHARRIEALAELAELAEDAGEPEVEAAGLDLREDYLQELLASLDGAALRHGPLRVVYDAMHGVGAGVLDAALERAGVRVTLCRGTPDPLFGGCPPDPAPQHLAALARHVRGLAGPRLGLATDGDADRFGVIDADGRMLTETEGLALLVDHLARTRRLDGGLALSIASGSLVERVALAHGLSVSRHPIGFKHLSRAIGAGAALAGDESGGFAFAPLGCDKDGVLAGCLFAEMAARDGVPLAARLAELERRHGRSACGRTATPAWPRTRDRLEKLLAAPPERVDRSAVRHARVDGGLHLTLDDGFLMLRASGTEPVLRVYAEAPTPDRLVQRLAAGIQLLSQEP